MFNHHRLFILLSLVLLLVGPSCNQPDRVRDLFDEGDRLLRDSLPEAALKKFQKGLVMGYGTSDVCFDQLEEADPGIRGLYGVINAYLQKGEYGEVKTHLQHAGTKPAHQMFILKKLLNRLEKDELYTDLLSVAESYLRYCTNRSDSILLYARLSRIHALKTRRDQGGVKSLHRENVEKTAMDYALQTEKLAGDGVSLFNMLWDKNEVDNIKDLLEVHDQLICHYEAEKDFYRFTDYLRQQNELLKFPQVSSLISEKFKDASSIIEQKREITQLELSKKYLGVISGLILIIVILTAGLFILWQINRRRAKERELQASLELLRVKKEEQHRISETLHDDVGSAMTLGRSHLRKMVLDGRSQAAADYIDELFTTLSDKISSVIFQEKDDPKNASLLQLIEKHCAEIEATCEKKVNIYAFGPDDYLQDAQRIKLNLIVKTALDNAIRHAHVDTVDLSYNSYEDYLNIMICDKGRGIAREEVRKKLQARLNRRAKRIGGQVLIDSRASGGTTVTIDVQVLEPA